MSMRLDRQQVVTLASKAKSHLAKARDAEDIIDGYVGAGVMVASAYALGRFPFQIIGLPGDLVIGVGGHMSLLLLAAPHGLAVKGKLRYLQHVSDGALASYAANLGRDQYYDAHPRTP